MKITTILIILLFPILCFAQDQDTTCFTNTQVQRIASTIDSLEVVTATQGQIITTLQRQVNVQDRINLQNELLLSIREDEVAALNAALEHSLGLNQQMTIKRKWYESPAMYYVYGAATIFGGALIVSLVR